MRLGYCRTGLGGLGQNKRGGRGNSTVLLGAVGRPADMVTRRAPGVSGKARISGGLVRPQSPYSCRVSLP